MALYTPSSPHIHAPSSVNKMMLTVVLALVPGCLLYVILFGWGIIIHMSLAVVTALAIEALMLKLRGRPIILFVSDGSAIVTGLLLALSIPPIAPWWITVIGISFAIIIAKHLYGGLGFNPFNPAMIGYVVLLISFPLEMSTWPQPEALSHIHLDFLSAAQLVFNAETLQNINLDALSGATPLDYLKSQLGLQFTVDEVINSHPIFHSTAGIWMNIAFLAGGGWLLYKKVINWHIPAAMLGSLFILSVVFYLFDPERFASPWFHLFNGATMLGAFFIATDPVSAATTNNGRLIYGIGIGILIFIIRTWGGYPDGVAFAVLLMNICAPTIDHYTKARVFGHPDK